MKKLIILILPLLAFIGGAAAGDMLHGGNSRPKVTEPQTAEAGAEPEKPTEEQTEAATDWFKFPNQFFIPILRNGSTTGIMVMSLTLEMSADARPRIEAQEHRLRDAMLNALMIEANTGAFDGNFTAEPSQARLRQALLSAAHKASGPSITRVLIEDIARQDQ
ncbi:hypothetical protein [Paracoccus laeviglucosivorans]|uniref:Flagellar protein FliL n=1 Tax=Paracoccus laeviglucosivorans TaxID=1197861 RepID=A0A521DC26_9RHOB|nr:hypothetical protein [Paracoccus laeviglucosivorans]SMO69233.1 hypothetical protein SAMN06265221_10793 [Paracoccus laeviglucosivorans]